MNMRKKSNFFAFRGFTKGQKCGIMVRKLNKKVRSLIES